MSRSKVCGVPIHIRVHDLQGREIDAIAHCTKAIGHHCWAGKKRDPVHSFRAASSSDRPSLGDY